MQLNELLKSLFIMKKVLFVVGSLRKQSFNRQVSDYVKSLLDGKVQVSELDYADMPFVNQDIEFPTPASVARVRKQVMEADAIWVFTPEYNYSYPPVVKNLFDWLSRPMTQERDSATAIRGRKVAVTGIGGKNNTKDCREKLTLLLQFIGAEVMENQVGLAVNVEAWTSDKVVLDDSQKAELQQQVADFLDFVD